MATRHHKNRLSWSRGSGAGLGWVGNIGNQLMGGLQASCTSDPYIGSLFHGVLCQDSVFQGPSVNDAGFQLGPSLITAKIQVTDLAEIERQPGLEPAFVAFTRQPNPLTT